MGYRVSSSLTDRRASDKSESLEENTTRQDGLSRWALLWLDDSIIVDDESNGKARYRWGSVDAVVVLVADEQWAEKIE